MKLGTDILLKKMNLISWIILNVISWIIFVGVCIDAGGVFTNTIYSIFFNASLASHFWGYLDLSKLFEFNQTAFVSLTALMSVVTILKAILFYFIIKIFHDKKLDFSNPFNPGLGNYIYKIAYCTLGIGLFSKWGGDLSNWITSQQISVPPIQELKMGGADVWLLMTFIIFVFAFIFKKGIELQSENELTV